MAREVEARLRLSAVDRTSKAFQAVSKRISDVERQTSRFNRAQMALQRTFSAIPVGGWLGGIAAGVGVTSAVRSFADLERQMIRIGITAGAADKEVSGMIGRAQEMALKYALPLEEVVSGLDTLTASGQSLDEAMAFLPSVLLTAQASGSAVADIGNTAVKAASALKIQASDMQRAFDIMVAGGKAGQFELKDMAEYIPELANSFASLGYEGQEGLQKLIALLQTLREDTGSASGAATQAQNIFGKMYSEQTANQFKKFGINLREEMKAAERAGEDALDAFVRISREALKGDLSKLPLLFTDQEFRLGMQSLITSADSYQRFLSSVNGQDVDGTSLRDFQRVLKGTGDEIQNLSTSWGNLLTAFGEGAAQSGVTDAIGAMTDELSYHTAVNKGLNARGIDSFWDRTMWGLEHGAGDKDIIAREAGWRPQGEREVFDFYKSYQAARVAGASIGPDLPTVQAGESPQAKALPSAMTAPGARDDATVTGEHGYDSAFLAAISDGAREAFIRSEKALANTVDSRIAAQIGSNGAGGAHNILMGREAPSGGSDDASDRWLPLKRFLLGAAAEPDFNAREHFRAGFKDAPSAAPIVEDRASRVDPEALRRAMEEGGQGAGQSITDAARAINEAGQEGGSAFARMLEGVGAQIGRDAAQAFKANVGTINVNARVNGNLASGDRGRNAPAAGTQSSGANGNSFGGPR